MTVRSEIPKAIDDFNPFIITTNDYLLAGIPTNAERLGISLIETAIWTGFAVEWTPLYISYTDEKVRRAGIVKNKLLSVIERCVAMNQTCHLLERIAASPGSKMEDMVVFNARNKYSKKRTFCLSITPISEQISASLQSLLDGNVVVKCYNSKNLASIVKEADCVQYLYCLSVTPPVSADTPGLMKERSAKAEFTLGVGGGNSFKTLYVYFRWFNTQHPDRAGPWSELYSTLIL